MTAVLGTFSQFASTVVHVYLLAMTTAIVWDVLQDLELQEALHDAGVTWVVPVRSPRKRRG